VQRQPALKADETGPHYNAADEQPRLLAILSGAYDRMTRAINVLVRSHFGLGDFFVDDSTTRRLLHHAAARVVRIDQTTRAAIAQTLQTGQARGYSNWQLAHGVPQDGYLGIDGLFKETWRNRPDTVARTELQEAQRAAAIERYSATGLVDRLQIIDGCQWDAPCAERNGKIVSIANPPELNHPNCTLVLVPVLREGHLPQPQPRTEAASQPPLL
jgi:hypothetical protein